MVPDHLLMVRFCISRDMFCAGRVAEEDLKRTQRACGGAVAASARDLGATVLGSAASFEERQVGAERFNIFTGDRTNSLGMKTNERKEEHFISS